VCEFESASNYLGAKRSLALGLLDHLHDVLERGKLPQRVVGHARHVLYDKALHWNDLVRERTSHAVYAFDRKGRLVSLLAALGGCRRELRLGLVVGTGVDTAAAECRVGNHGRVASRGRRVDAALLLLLTRAATRRLNSIAIHLGRRKHRQGIGVFLIVILIVIVVVFLFLRAPPPRLAGRRAAGIIFF